MTFELTEKEIKELKDLKKSFKASMECVDDILAGNEIETNLDYIVRDWVGYSCISRLRNDELMSWLRTIASALDRLRKEEVVSNV